MTHGVVALLHGEFGTAITYNAFAPVFVVGLMALVVSTHSVAIAGRLDSLTARLGRARFGLGLLAAFLAYSLLRNIVGSA